MEMSSLNVLIECHHLMESGPERGRLSKLGKEGYHSHAFEKNSGWLVSALQPGEERRRTAKHMLVLGRAGLSGHKDNSTSPLKVLTAMKMTMMTTMM